VSCDQPRANDSLRVRADNANAITDGVTEIRGSGARRKFDDENSGTLAALPKTLAMNGIVGYVRCISSLCNLNHSLTL